MATPWLTGPCQWDDILQPQPSSGCRRNLAEAISKLTVEDYAENGLGELLKIWGNVDDLNRTIFRRLMGTITNRPVGKNGTRRAVVLSPHPTTTSSAWAALDPQPNRIRGPHRLYGQRLPERLRP